MKNNLKCIGIVIVSIILLLSSSAILSFAGSATGDSYDTSVYDPEKANVKPTVSLSKMNVSLDEELIEMCLYINDADGEYSKTKFHVDFDTRLILVDIDGDYAEMGDAGKRLISTAEKDGEHGLVLCTETADANDAKKRGRDGVLWRIFFKLPDNAKAFDKYNVEIMYKEGDYFLNTNQDEDEQRMQAWVFTNGIEQGYIEVLPPGHLPTTTSTVQITTTVTTQTVPVTTTDTTTSLSVTPNDKYTLGDVDSDGFINAVDASKVLSEYAIISSNNASVLSEIQKAASDVNKDGVVDAVDASVILAYYAYVSVESGDIKDMETFLSDFKLKQL